MRFDGQNWILKNRITIILDNNRYRNTRIFNANSTTTYGTLNHEMQCFWSGPPAWSIKLRGPPVMSWGTLVLWVSNMGLHLTGSEPTRGPPAMSAATSEVWGPHVGSYLPTQLFLSHFYVLSTKSAATSAVWDPHVGSSGTSDAMSAFLDPYVGPTLPRHYKRF